MELKLQFFLYVCKLVADVILPAPQLSLSSSAKPETKEIKYTMEAIEDTLDGIPQITLMFYAAYKRPLSGASLEQKEEQTIMIEQFVP